MDHTALPSRYRPSRTPSAEPIQSVGRVKWYDEERRYGFVVLPDNTEAFIHYSILATHRIAPRVLVPGTIVRCSVLQGRRGKEVSALEVL